MRKKRATYMSEIIILLIDKINHIKADGSNSIIKRFKIKKLIKKAKKDIVAKINTDKYTSSDIVSFGLFCRTARIYNILKDSSESPTINFFQDHNNIWPMSSEVLINVDCGYYTTCIKIKTHITSEYDNSAPINIEWRNKSIESNTNIEGIIRDIGYAKEVQYISKKETIDISGHEISFFDLLYNTFIIYIETIIDSIKETYL